MDLKQYHTLWNDAWRFFKCYAEQLPLPDEKWEDVIRMVEEYGKRHPENEYAARKIIITVFTLLEHEHKQLTGGTS